MRWDFFVQHYADEAAAAPGPQAAAAGHLLSARRHTRRLHRAQCDDPDGAARFRLGRHRGTDRRCVVARVGHAALLPATGACRYRPVWRTLSQLGLDMTGHGWDGWLPSECAMPWQVVEDRRLLATLTESAFGGLARIIAPGANPPAAAPVATGPQRQAPVAAQCRWALLHAAQHRSAPEGWNARTPARCRGTPSGSADGSSCMRWRRACCSMATIVPPASSI